MENFFTELSSIITDDFFGGIVEFVKNIFGAFEDLLSSESTDGSSE